MTEARITCTCQNLILADLGLRLTNGQIVYVTEMEAKKSQDLRRAAMAGGVHIQYIQRAREIRNPAVGNPQRIMRATPAMTTPMKTAPVEVPISTVRIPLTPQFVELQTEIPQVAETPEQHTVVSLEETAPDSSLGVKTRRKKTEHTENEHT